MAGSSIITPGYKKEIISERNKLERTLPYEVPDFTLRGLSKNGSSQTLCAD
jgi:hypothetical protein